MREFRGDWRDLFYGFRIALDLRKMFLGLLGMVFSFAGLAVVLFFGALPEKEALWDLLKEMQFGEAFYIVLEWVQESYLLPLGAFLEHPGRMAFFPSSDGAGTELWPMLVLGGGILWLVFVWSKFGGAISRITVVEIARDERITIHEALDYAKKKFTSYFWSTVAVAVAFFFFFLCNVAGGLVGAIPYAGPVLAALLCPLAFLGGFLMLLIALGGLFGWPLMSPAVSAEGTDAFDAVSRAFSYLYTRPWHYLWYGVVSAAYGFISVSFVWFFTLLMVRLSIGSVQVGMGSRLDIVVDRLYNIHYGGSIFDGLSLPQMILLVILGTVAMLLYGLAFGYLVSFFYTARSLTYFILRKKVDATEMTEVFLEDEEDDEFFTQDIEDTACETGAEDGETDEEAAPGGTGDGEAPQDAGAPAEEGAGAGEDEAPAQDEAPPPGPADADEAAASEDAPADDGQPAPDGDTPKEG